MPKSGDSTSLRMPPRSMSAIAIYRQLTDSQPGGGSDNFWLADHEEWWPPYFFGECVGRFARDSPRLETTRRGELFFAAPVQLTSPAP
jgi:hypothetical protein